MILPSLYQSRQTAMLDRSLYIHYYWTLSMDNKKLPSWLVSSRPAKKFVVLCSPLVVACWSSKCRRHISFFKSNDGRLHSAELSADGRRTDTTTVAIRSSVSPLMECSPALSQPIGLNSWFTFPHVQRSPKPSLRGWGIKTFWLNSFHN